MAKLDPYVRPPDPLLRDATKKGLVVALPGDFSKGPDKRQYRDIPAIGLGVFQDPATIRSALRQMDQSGTFLAAGLLMDEVVSDDRVASVLSTRINTLLGKDVELAPQDETDADLKCAEEIQTRWESMFSRAMLGQIMVSGLMLGIGIGENVWEQVDGQWVQHLKYWHPQFIQWRWDLRRFTVITQDGVVEVPEDGGGGKWFIFAPYGYYLGWKRALLRPLAVPWLLRQLTYTDWGRYNEIHGKPIIGAVMPPQTSPSDKAKFVGDIFEIGSNAVVELEQGEDGNKWDLKLIEAMSTHHECFTALKEACDSAITIAIAGQNLTTEVQEGSRAAAQVHDDVRSDVLTFDAVMLAVAIMKYGLAPYVAFNHADVEAPHARYQTDPPEDLNTLATMVASVATALTAFSTSSAPIDVRALLEKFKLPLLTEQQHAAQQAEKIANAQKAIGGAGPAGAPGEGEKQPPEGEEKEPPAAGAKLSLRTDGLPHGAQHGQSYADDLVRQGIGRALPAVEIDLRMVLSEVLHSSSPEDLRKRLVEALPRMKPDAFAAVMAKAMVMASLAGRSAVLHDV